MAKILLISGMICALLSGCNKGDETTKTATTPKPPQSAVTPTPSEKASPQPMDNQGRIDQLKKNSVMIVVPSPQNVRLRTCMSSLRTKKLRSD